MKKLILTTLVAFSLLGVFGLSPTSAVAQTPSEVVTGGFCDLNNDGVADDPVAGADTACDVNAGNAQSTLGSIVTTITQTLVFVVGGLSVIVIVVGGLMYVLSGGDGNNTKRAKDAIQYAIIGLVVALIAQGLVSFVLRRL